MTHNESCPLCARDLISPQQVDVCMNCHNGLQLTGAVPVTTTGEFQAVMGPAPKPMTSAPRGAQVDDEVRCCWCNKEPESVRKILSQGGYHICNECVALCADILRMELGDEFGS